MNVPFPYDINATGGWYDETDCPSNGTVTPGTTYKRHADWKTVATSTAWVTGKAKAQAEAEAARARAEAGAGTGPRPWFAYQGMNIVHPAYVTNEYWFGKIDYDAVTVPEWKPLLDLHPCDLQVCVLAIC